MAWDNHPPMLLGPQSQTRVDPIIQRLQELPSWGVERFSKSFDVGERDVPTCSLYCRHISAVKVTFMCQTLLRPTQFHSLQTNPVRQHFAQVAWIRGLRGADGFSGHRPRICECYICIYGVCFTYG